MNTLEVLNVVMEKQEHGKTVPMRLSIILDGKTHLVHVDREDENVQNLVRSLVMTMLLNEVDNAGRKILSDYIVRVRVWHPKLSYYFKEITVRAHSPLDARVMALILVCDPDKCHPTMLQLAHAYTEIV